MVVTKVAMSDGFNKSGRPSLTFSALCSFFPLRFFVLMLNRDIFLCRHRFELSNLCRGAAQPHSSFHIFACSHFQGLSEKLT
ncbi:hypothetical protein L6164_027224 [Bauhinia variegata]|uniref:Uncharacterized protein n=1 Tax=Bauhinia variegata TaxID=167791 RepID=A0ACB9LT51_BAUVA|nr:hypothetical protein L6164_027224 [Bauhinia variegata]